jgi:hypothetical protein
MMQGALITIGVLLAVTQIMTATGVVDAHGIPNYCPATDLGQRLCFPHDGYIDWSINPGVGNFSPQHMEGKVSGIPDLSWIFDATPGAAFYARGRCTGSVPDTKCPDSAVPAQDTWLAWGGSGEVRIRFSKPVSGVGMTTATPGAFELIAYDVNGNVIERVSFPAFTPNDFVGISSQSPAPLISSISFVGREHLWTGDIQILSRAPQPVTGDFDGNGVPDLYWQQDGTNTPAAWYMGGADGSTILSGKVLRGPQDGWRIAAIADLDGDRHPDLLWQQDGTNIVNVWYMGGEDGNTVLSTKTLTEPEPGWRIVGIADLNGDGKPDLIWQQDETNVPAVWYMGGPDDSTFLSGQLLSGAQPGWRIVGVADLDNNGHPDLIWQQDGSNAAGVWYMAGPDGNTIIGGRTLSEPQPGWRIMAVADLDNNGHPDLIWQQDGSNMPVVWYMTGPDGGTIMRTQTLSGPQPGWRIVGPH